MWQTIRATGHYGIGQISSLGVALTVFPGFALQQPSSYGLTEGWLPVLAVAVYNLSDFAVRVANASIPCMAKPSALKHAALVVANLSAAAGVVISCVLEWSDDIILLFHAMLAATSSWQIAVCFLGADGRAAARKAPRAVRERTGTVMQGLILVGITFGLGLSTAVARVREGAAA